MLLTTQKMYNIKKKPFDTLLNPEIYKMVYLQLV